MKRVQDFYLKFSGYKTFIISLAGLVYGIGTGNIEIILASLAIFGFRDAMKN